jgi:hypothetical protein
MISLWTTPPCAEIMVAVEALVVQPLARAIGRRRDGAAAARGR